MRDWSAAFRRASFRGVPFWVDEDGPEYGRRVAVHNIVGGELPVTEDLGRTATAFRIRAYVVSDTADAEGWALEAACSSPGASLLAMPMDPARMVHCTGCTRSRSKDRNGYIAYDLSFVVAGSAAIVGATGVAALRMTFAVDLGPASLALSVGL